MPAIFHFRSTEICGKLKTRVTFASTDFETTNGDCSTEITERFLWYVDIRILITTSAFSFCRSFDRPESLRPWQCTFKMLGLPNGMSELRLLGLACSELSIVSTVDSLGFYTFTCANFGI